MSKLHIPMDYDRYGYRFMSSIRQNGKHVGYHPGADLNWGSGAADLGRPIVAMYDGIVKYSRAGSGWGNMMVIHHPDLGPNIYSRLAHFDKRYVSVGEKVTAGQLIGTCGRTGTTSPHCHFEVWKRKLPTWTKYIYGWSKAEMFKYFHDPIDYIKATNLTINKKEEVPDYAKPSVAKAIESGIATNWEHPNEIVGNSTLEWILVKLKALQKNEGKVTKARMIVALDRLGLLD